jgi:hypothetical protein
LVLLGPLGFGPLSFGSALGTLGCGAFGTLGLGALGLGSLGTLGLGSTLGTLGSWSWYWLGLLAWYS